MSAVLSAGEVLLGASQASRTLRAKRLVHEVKHSRKSYSTAVDLRCEEAMRNILLTEFPRDGFLGEEGTCSELGAERVWVVDPLDGTLSYAHGLDSYATAVGLIYRNEPVLGVVFLPEQDELFVAEKGSGAFLNGARIYISEQSVLEKSIVSMDHRIFRIGEYPRATADLVKTVQRLRVSESCSQELCYLACGRLDGFIRTLQPTYDYVMGKVIVEEAGGQVRDFNGQEVRIQLNRDRNTNLIAGSGRLVGLLRGYVAEEACRRCMGTRRTSKAP